MNAALFLQMAVDGMGERIALSGAQISLSYRQLEQRASAAAVWMRTRPELKHLVFLGFNGPQSAVALFAAAFAQVPFVPLNYRLPDADLQGLIARCAPALVVADETLMARAAEIPGITLISTSAFDELTQGALSAEYPDDGDAVAVQLFTSGTTASPKAALLRHRHLASYIVDTVEFMGAAEDEALLVSVPPYHVAGVASLLSSVYSGRRIVQLAAFSPEEWIELARREAVTHAMLVPTMLSRVLAELERSGQVLPRLRHLSYGGGRMPQSVVERALRMFPGVDLVNAYGLTETSSTISVLGPEDHRLAFNADAPAARRRLGSVGRPLPSVEVSIRDQEGTTLPAGRAGEIWVRGEQVSGEYAGMSAKRPDGWLPTKDAGWLDDDGYLYVDGRLDDVIVRGGENISPGEIEDVLCTHACVREAAVIGVHDDEWGERIVAAVVPRSPIAADELKEFVRARLRSTKTPEEVFFMEELPFNDMGKLLRRVLRQQLSGLTTRSA